jgi:RyR domain
MTTGAAATENLNDFFYEGARVTHAAVRAYQGVLGEQQAPEWDQLSAEERNASFQGFAGAFSSVVLHPFAGDLELASAEHQAWTDRKLDGGWTYGERKDPVRKTHPDITAWENLSPAARRKDLVVLGIARAFASTVDRLR